MEQPGRESRRQLFGLSAVLLGILVSLLLVLLLELGAREFLEADHRRSYPLLWSGAKGPGPAQAWDETSRSLTYLDPLLGFAYDPMVLAKRARAVGARSEPGFAIHDPLLPEDGEVLEVLVLGGSTTASRPGGWVGVLAELFAKEGHRVRIRNGGVPGYSSTQDFLKLVRDGLPLEPDLVIALEGVNDLGFAHADPRQPMVHPYGLRVLDEIANPRLSGPTPNLRAAIASATGEDEWAVEGISLGTPANLSPAESWWRNARAASAVSRAFGARYLVFLQPTMGVGDFAPSARESEMLQALNSMPEYLQDAQAFYTQARHLSAEAEDVVDLTGLFAGESGVYSDARHQTPRGGRLLAEAIYAEIQGRGWLEGR